MEIRFVRHLIAMAGGSAIALIWIRWGFDPVLIPVFLGLVLLDVVLWHRQKREEERPPGVED
jgi:hypothetical protein